MKRSAYAKIAGLAILEIALISLLFVPIQTHAVLVNVPRDASHQATSQSAEWFPVIAVIAATTLAFIILLAVLITPIWLAVRIIRRERSGA